MKKIISLSLLTIITLFLLIYSYNKDQKESLANNDSVEISEVLGTNKSVLPSQTMPTLEQLAKETKSKKDNDNILSLELEKELKENQEKQNSTKSDDFEKKESKAEIKYKDSSDNKRQIKVEYQESIQSIDYKVIKQETSNLVLGESKVVQKGKSGKKKLIRKYHNVEGTKTLVEENEQVIENPVNEIIEIGTKKVEVSQGTSNRDMAYQTLAIVNEIRVSNGLSSLSWSATLESASNIRAKEININFSHTRPNGQPWYSVSDSVMAENIAYGQSSSQAVINSFMSSPVHRENILSSRWSSMAVSVYIIDGVYYWVQVFS